MSKCLKDFWETILGRCVGIWLWVGYYLWLAVEYLHFEVHGKGPRRQRKG